MSSRTYSLILLLLIAALFLSFLINLSVGEIFVNPFDVFDSKEGSTGSLLINTFRLPKALTAILVGVALSISGLLMQTLFRNPIAGPYVLGISSGASLGVSVVIMGSSFIAGAVTLSDYSIVAGALIGSLSMMLVLLMVLKFIKDVMTLLIVGMMFGAFASALSSIMQYFSPSFQVKSFVLWTLGNLSNVTYSQLGIMLFFAILALIIVLFALKGLNLLVLGHDNLLNFGVNRVILQYAVLIATAILAGVVTAFCGPIGFVGIIVPHFARMLVRSSDHIKLLPVTAILGAILMLFSDSLSHLPANGIVLPINSVTAFIGIPVIFWIIFRPSKKIEM